MRCDSLDQHEALLDEFRQRDWHRSPGFVRDGILDPQRWGKRPRVLFLLKEAHDRSSVRRDWDLREFLREVGTKYRMWSAAASWASVAQGRDGASMRPYLDLMSDSNELRESLLSSAVVNLKKSNGVSRSENDDLDLWVKRDGDLTRRQIELIAPQIVICGSTWERAARLWSAANLGNNFYKVGDLLVMDFWHPSVISGEVRAKHYCLFFQWFRATCPSGLWNSHPS